MASNANPRHDASVGVENSARTRAVASAWRKRAGYKSLARPPPPKSEKERPICAIDGQADLMRLPSQTAAGAKSSVWDWLYRLLRVGQATIFATRLKFGVENFLRTACKEAFSASCNKAHISFAHDLICDSE